MYVKKTEFGDAVYKVRVVDVKPLDDTSGTDSDSAPKCDDEDETTLKTRSGDDDRTGIDNDSSTEADSGKDNDSSTEVESDKDNDQSTEVDSGSNSEPEVVTKVTKDVESTESLDDSDDGNTDIDNVNTGSPEELDLSQNNEISKDTDEIEVNNINAIPDI